MHILKLHIIQVSTIWFQYSEEVRYLKDTINGKVWARVFK